MNLSSLQKLENLLAEIPGDDVCNLEQVHGMLTAILIGPAIVKVSEWLPFVFRRSGEMPEFKSQKQAEQLMALLMELNNDIVDNIDSMKFVPLMGHEKSGDEKRPDPLPWCASFISGMTLWGEEWLEGEKGNSDPVFRAFLTPIIYFVDDEETGVDARMGKSNEAIEEMERKLIATIPQSVWNIREYWRKQACKDRMDISGAIGGTSSHSPNVQGRNERCYCGSGKKFKKCCGKNSQN